MMFLIKTAFWLTVLIMLLPTNHEQQREVYGTAEAAVKDIRTFCVRNPDVCETSRTAFDTFSQKAQFGARMVMDFVQGSGGEGAPATQYTSSVEPASGSAFLHRTDDGSRSTLTADDLRPAWRGPAAQSGT